MAGRPNRRSTGNVIRGPQSALTDYLAANQISAQQIALDYQNRVRQLEEQTPPEDAEEDNFSDENEDPAERKKRKRKEEKAIAAIKASKEFKRRKFDRQKEYGSDAESNDDILARDMLKKPKKALPKPGQFANCEECEKRFTVTPYTIAGQDGGFLCMKCGKAFKDTQKKSETASKQQKKQVQRGRKRQQESDRMMGDVRPGAKSLVEHCVKKVADVVNDIEEFGDLPQNLLNRLSQILSKKRVLTPRTLQLFLQPDIDRIAVYDCGKLETEDFQKIFAFMPNVERVNLRFAGQYKDESLRYMIEKCPRIKHLQLGASNLVSDEAWIELFQQRGENLESLKLSELNDSMKDETMNLLTQHCINLKRLKLRTCSHLTGESLHYFTQLKHLEHLTLAVGQDASPETLTSLITCLGPNLKTLCLEDFYDLDDTILASIKQHCTRLTKLRLTGSTSCTDSAFSSLFTTWSNPPIPYIDLSSNRDVDSSNPDPDETCPIGLASEGFKAMMNHSGQVLHTLDLHSCRHITHDALLSVFDGKNQYPELRRVDLSFVTHVDDVIMNGIFKSCPNLEKLAVFACFAAKETLVPAGIAVIGLPDARSAVVTEGN